MKLHINSTSTVAAVDGVKARLWEGKTETGIPVHVFITRMACLSHLDVARFEKELHEQQPPKAGVEAPSVRLIL